MLLKSQLKTKKCLKRLVFVSKQHKPTCHKKRDRRAIHPLSPIQPPPNRDWYSILFVREVTITSNVIYSLYKSDYSQRRSDISSFRP